MDKVSSKTRKMTTMAMLFALASVLSILEHQLPGFPPLFPPNIRFGLSNVIIMYTLFFMGVKEGYGMAILKSLLVLLQRGPQAAFNSIFGGLLSITVMALLAWVFRERISYLVLSVAGAVAHNMGQMIAASLQFQVNMVKIYWPLLVVAGIVLGAITGTMLQVILPVFQKIQGVGPAVKAKNTHKKKDDSSV